MLFQEKGHEKSVYRSLNMKNSEWRTPSCTSESDAMAVKIIVI
jgi:hypothetical protein